MNEFIQQPKTLKDFLDRINQFLIMYGGRAIKSNSPKSFEVMSDFLLVVGVELNFKIAPNVDMSAADSANKETAK
jgi:hypothetical protein